MSHAKTRTEDYGRTILEVEDRDGDKAIFFPATVDTPHHLTAYVTAYGFGGEVTVGLTPKACRKIIKLLSGYLADAEARS